MNCHWRTSNLREEDGILVGADITQEWLLPWWWEHYRKENPFPVAFIDFGMSSEMKEWCKGKGELISLRIFEGFVKEKHELDPKIAQCWEAGHGKHSWDCRNVWFKKPFAFLQTPFQRTLWIDADCEVRGPLQDLFAYADSPSGIAMAKDSSNDLIDSQYPAYNSGVVSFRRNIEVVLAWACDCIEKNGLYSGDQEVFSHTIGQRNIPIAQIPSRYNWSRMQPENPNAVIFHWHGPHGKYCIRTQMNIDNL